MSMPTPKSKPSRTKYPTNRMATMMNQRFPSISPTPQYANDSCLGPSASWSVTSLSRTGGTSSCGPGPSMM
ncbi:Uncharacterised protein [Mycobacteroides abscessus subsp. abscessus]|nr:Uncharacterised protein [Mycobacteroides abscessus subsp. abscessus]